MQPERTDPRIACIPHAVGYTVLYFYAQGRDITAGTRTVPVRMLNEGGI
ncbi:hypothetical protein [Paenibacillus sp. Y412MC10]|nr:hypothetical protein [Paenibacillus sp. Y412MC10]